MVPSNFVIIDKSRYKNDLLLLESLHQKIKKPSIGTHLQSTPLLSFDQWFLTLTNKTPDYLITYLLINLFIFTFYISVPDVLTFENGICDDIETGQVNE